MNTNSRGQWPPSGNHPTSGMTYRGWSYPQAFPNPPPSIAQNTPDWQRWFNMLNQQYPAGDRDRYHKAWVSWFNTPAGQQWNHYPHSPNWGPYAPRPHTQAVAQNYERARVGFNQQILRNLPAAQQGLAFEHPVMHNRTMTASSIHPGAPSETRGQNWHQVYTLGPYIPRR